MEFAGGGRFSRKKVYVENDKNTNAFFDGAKKGNRLVSWLQRFDYADPLRVGKFI